MKYESMRPIESPYKLWIGAMGKMEEHRHSDLELAYCFSGEFDIEVDKKLCTVKAGELLIVPPMLSHGGLVRHRGEVRALSAILGSSFLKNYFPDLSGIHFPVQVCSLNRATGDAAALRSLFEETIRLCRDPSPTAALKKTGNLYRIIAYLIELFALRNEDSVPQNGEMRKIASVERALELIYSQYTTALDVDAAAMVSGYSKSNFCRVFREVVGESFHKHLNRYRINCATGLLRETSLQIADIAAEVGLPETKSFCRVFRETMGMTPGEYRARERCGESR